MRDDTPVSYADLEDLREKIGVSSPSLFAQLFGQVTASPAWRKWRKSTRDQGKPAPPQLAFLIRWLDANPSKAWLESWPTPKQAFDHLRTLDKTMTLREFAYLMGLEQSAGYRMVRSSDSPRMGFNATRVIGHRLLYVLMSFKTKEELDQWREIVRTEAMARGLHDTITAWGGTRAKREKIEK